MLKKIIDIFGNSILFYADKEGNSVFKNYCLFKSTGCRYKLKLSKQEAGKILEYRLEMDKTMNLVYILIPIFVYFLFIHMKFSLLTVLFCEFLWIILVSFARLKASSLYSRFLNKSLGAYELTEFRPHLNQRRRNEIRTNFLSKTVLIIAAIIIFAFPAFLLQAGMKYSLKARKPHIKIASAMSKIYSVFYPKTQNIYDYDACIKYLNNDYKGALEDYKAVIDITGKNFSSKDYVRFANMLYLEKNLSSPAQALDMFNDYMTRKKISAFEKAKLLWIESIFSIENNVSDYVITDYDDFLLSLGDKNERDKFYATCDKAYMLYLMNEYSQAIELYNQLIPYAVSKKEYSQQLKSLYAERGFARNKTGDAAGANQDFMSSKISPDEINSYEPSYIAQSFVIDEF